MLKIHVGIPRPVFKVLEIQATVREKCFEMSTLTPFFGLPLLEVQSFQEQCFD